MYQIKTYYSNDKCSILFYMCSSDRSYVYKLNDKIRHKSIEELIGQLMFNNTERVQLVLHTIHETYYEFKDLNDLKKNHPELFI